MRIGLGIAVMGALIAAAASATYYLDERFDNGCPPPGWTTADNGRTYFHIGSGGPAGLYATASATVGSMTSPAWAYLDSSPFAVIGGQTLYYRFIYEVYRSPSLGRAWGSFYIIVAATGQTLISWSRDTSTSAWEELSSSYLIPYSTSVKARWRFDCGISSMGGQSGRFSLDTCQIGNENFSALTPLSFGRVKAVFR